MKTQVPLYQSSVIIFSLQLRQLPHLGKQNAMTSWCSLPRQSQRSHHSCLLELRMRGANLAFLSQHLLEMLSVITAASLALKSPSDQRCLLYNEGTCWREKSAIPLLKQALFTMRSSSEAALLNLLYSQHVYGLCSSCRIQEACTPKPSGASANPKGRLVLHAHRNTILLHSYDSQTVHATIPPLGKYLASQIRNFMIF